MQSKPVGLKPYPYKMYFGLSLIIWEKLRYTDTKIKSYMRTVGIQSFFPVINKFRQFIFITEQYQPSKLYQYSTECILNPVIENVRYADI